MAPTAQNAAAPAPPAAGSNAASNNTIAGLVLEPYGHIPALWATFFVFGNLFAVFWLVRAFLNAHPEVAYQLGLALAKIGIGSGPSERVRASARAGRNSGPEKSSSGDGKQHIITADSAASGATGAAEAAEGASRRHHHHHHAQPIICTPSTELSTPANGSARLDSGVGGLGSVVEDSSSSCSSYSSDDESSRQPVQLDWVNMCYSVNSAQGKKTIVQGIYGCAKPYQLQGLMGPSGAGKSTLMDLLSMRTDHDGTAAAQTAAASTDTTAHGMPETDAEGQEGAAATAAAGDQAGVGVGLVPSQLLVNGTVVKRKAFMAISAYVPQHDNLVPTMTAWEAVAFYTSIILPPETPADVAKGRITRVLRMMGLSNQQHTLVGGTLPGGIMLRGMSGGERKRLAIACGVVAGPSLVFLDEPTSGLDSFAALNVVLFLKSMATERGATLLASLHQPRAAIWSQMDQVTLLSSGRLMYTGPTEGLVPWFMSLGYSYNPETHGMASDWALDLVSLGFTKPHHEAADAPAGEDEQQQQGAVQLQGSVRYRGSQNPSSGASDNDSISTGYASADSGWSGQQAGQLQAAPSMMSSKQELTDAAEAFLEHLQLVHPEWFNRGASPVLPLHLPLNDTLRAREAWEKNSSSDDAESSGAATTQTTSMVSGPMTMYRGAPGQLAYQDASHLHQTRAVQQQRTQWWQAAGTRGGPPAPPPPASVASSDGGGSSAAGFPDQDRPQQRSLLPGGPASSKGTFNPKKLSFVEEAGPFASPEAFQQGLVVQPQQQQQQQGMWYDVKSALHKFSALVWRELLITTRNPADVGGRMMTFTYVSFISGLVAWSLPGDANSMFQRMSVCYAVLTFYFLMPFVFMSIFTSDKRFFAADTTARLYHPAQYYFSKVVVTMPFNIVVAIVFHLVYYGMAGMRHGAQYMAASCGVCILVGLIAMQAIYCCAIMASSQDLAFVYAIGWTSLNLLVNPYMYNFNLYSLGWGFSWLRFLSPCNFAWQALINIEFGGRGFNCDHGSGAEAVGLIPALLPDDPAFRLVRANINNLGRISTGGRCVASGDAIIQIYTMGLSYWEIIGVLIGFYVVFLAATYLVVWRSSKKKSKI